jgi:hypothetical protein
MTTTKPSKLSYVLDVPSCTKFKSNFIYNYFDKNERLLESQQVPDEIRLKSSEVSDSKFFNLVSSKVPRLITFDWSIIINKQGIDNVEDEQDRNKLFISNQNFIRDNLDKLVTEDSLCGKDYTALTFQEGNLSEKAFYITSGTYVQQTIDNPNLSADNTTRASYKLQAKLNSKKVNPEFVNLALSQNKYGLNYEYHNFDNKDGQVSLNEKLEELDKVSINVQINNNVISTILNLANDPLYNESYSFNNLKEDAKRLQTNSLINNSQISEYDYELYVPYVDVEELDNNTYPKFSPNLVGFIIYKSEILDDGSILQKEPIIIENNKARHYADYEIKYGTTYSYKICAIYTISMLALDKVNQNASTIKVLVSSKPTHVEYVNTIEKISPPPPQDLEFIWDYKKRNDRFLPGALMMYWSFPVNSQMDIKKFQVLRRRTLQHPFEIIKIYDWDDSVIKSEQQENWDPKLIETIKSPVAYWYDTEFTKTSRFIYALASIDAHGYISDYSEQFEIWFDNYDKKIKKRLVSLSGAPRHYPNLFLEKDLFVDTIKVSGNKSKKLNIYFNPEYYNIVNSDGSFTKIISSKEGSNRFSDTNTGYYRLQFINLENQKQQTCKISINDPDNMI